MSKKDPFAVITRNVRTLTNDSDADLLPKSEKIELIRDSINTSRYEIVKFKNAALVVLRPCFWNKSNRKGQFAR
jgi:hypothetical protein